jgi:hypothetical protein
MKVHYLVKPLESVGPVRLGMSRAEVQNVMQVQSTPFLKTVGDKIETDAFYDSHFQVFYNSDTATVEYVELTCNSPFSVELLGIDPFATKANPLVKKIAAIAAFDKDDPELGYSYVFPDLELSFWRSSPDKKFFQTIGIGIRGYYSKKF